MPGERQVDVFVTLHGDRVAALAAHGRADERAAIALAIEMAAALRPAIERGETALVDVPGIGAAVVQRWRGGPATPGGWHVTRTAPVSTAKKVVTAIHAKAAQTAASSLGTAAAEAAPSVVIWVDLSPLRFHAGALGPRDLLDGFRSHARDALTAGAYDHVAGVVLYATEWVDNDVLLERLEPIAMPHASTAPQVLRDLLARPCEVERTVASLARSVRA